MSYLPWISDSDLQAAVKKLATSVFSARAKAERNISRNVLDPFGLLFNISFLSHDVATWKENEIVRQAEKALSNAVGDFHQEIIAHVAGWHDPQTAQDFDLIHKGKKIVVEMKNKYNTLNAEGLKTCFQKLNAAVNVKHSAFYGYKAYCVNIVPKRLKTTGPLIGIVPFQVKDNSSSTPTLKAPNVFLIDGHTFYKEATGSPTALHDLLFVLPQVIQNLKQSKKKARLDKSALDYIQSVFEDTYSSKS